MFHTISETSMTGWNDTSACTRLIPFLLLFPLMLYIAKTEVSYSRSETLLFNFTSKCPTYCILTALILTKTCYCLLYTLSLCCCLLFFLLFCTFVAVNFMKVLYLYFFIIIIITMFLVCSCCWWCSRVSVLLCSLNSPVSLWPPFPQQNCLVINSILNTLWHQRQRHMPIRKMLTPKLNFRFKK